MSFKEKMNKYLADSFLKKNGDRLTQVQGNVVSLKIERKTILWIFNKLTVTLLVRPDRSKSIIKCIFKRSKWFKTPEFMTVNQGNLVAVQGLKTKIVKKGKETKEFLEIMNVRNLTTRKDLVAVEGAPKQQVQRARQQKFK